MALMHMVLHLCLHVIKFLLLVVRQYFTDFAGGAFMQAAYLGSPVIRREGIILHKLLHLAMRIFDNGFDFGLLIIW